MTSALSPTPPPVSATPHEDDTLLRIVLDRPKGNIPTMEALRQPLATVERQYVDQILTSRDGNQGVTAYLERRKPVWEDR